MKKEYGLYYHYQKEGDELLILFSPLLVNRREMKGDVLLSYHDDVLVSYTIYKISKIIKIHIDGLIVCPNKELIDIVNIVLEKNNLEGLDYIRQSGFYIATVTNIDKDIRLKSGDKTFICRFNDKIKMGDRLVVAETGAFLFDKRQANEDMLCTFKMLDINNIDEILIDSTLEEGDFFKIEA